MSISGGKEAYEVSSRQEFDSSDTLSPGECSVRIIDELKIPSSHQERKVERWWLKKSDKLDDLSKKADHNKVSGFIDATSSMREFLEKEKQCKYQKSEAGKDKDDTLCDILASAAFDKYTSDFENATDDDIGSLLEEMSKIAGALSPNSAPERSKSGEVDKISTEEEKSVEELLEEAEKLVRENASLSKSASRSDTLVPDNQDAHPDDEKSARKLEVDIFQLIEREVNKETEKIKKSPQTLRERSPSPDCVFVYENIKGLKPPINLELQKKRFEEQKVEVSSSSDLDDPIEKHSKSEDLKSLKEAEDKTNLRKEIIDVDKNFFDNLLRQSNERADGKLSGSSSLGQEDFSHFLKILQQQSGTDKVHQDQKSGMNGTGDLISGLPSNPAVFPEKEIEEILEKEMSNIEASYNKAHEPNNDNGKIKKNSPDKPLVVRKSSLSKKSSIDRSEKFEKTQSNYLQQEIKKVNIPNELYTVGLTPRLELFADAIPKLIAEKSSENLVDKNQLKANDNKNDKVIIHCDNRMTKSEANLEHVNKGNKSQKHKQKLTEKKTAKIVSLGPSRSFDQLPKPRTTFRSSLDDVRNSKSADCLKKSPSSKSAVKPKICEQKNPLHSNILASKVKVPIKPTISKQFNLPVRPSTSKGHISESIVKQLLAAGEKKSHLSKDEWEILCHEERHKNVLLKNQIEAEAKIYKQQMDGMRTSFEGELFALKKQNIILKAKIDELSFNERKEKRMEVVNSQVGTRVMLLEKELEKQESLINAYESENKKLMENMKVLQEEVKKQQAKNNVKESVADNGQIKKLNDVIKDLKEEILKLNYEISDSREKNNEIAVKNDDMLQQNSLLQEELFMFKEQLKTKDKFITDKLQTLSLEEMGTRRKMEEMRVELKAKTDKLRINQSEFDKYQQAVAPLEKELLELRVREQVLHEKLQVSRSHVEREKVLTQKLKDQVILDNKKILDLNRQVREMERILKRKNPDSASAIILSAKSNGERIHLEKIRLLEERIASLEGELAAKEEIGNEKLNNLRKIISEIKEKYTMQIFELENKLSDSMIKAKALQDAFTQTKASMESKGIETVREDKNSPNERDDRRRGLGIKQNGKEDAHLIATIRGLKLELANKDKAFVKFTKELQELQKTNRKLIKEREKVLSERRNCKTDNDKEKNVHKNDQNSNIYENGLTNGQNLAGSSTKLYDPLQYVENGDSSIMKLLNDENEFLKEELKKIKKDYMSLKNKRLHDLNLLQEEHEREIASLVKEYSVKFGDSKVVKLQGQINTQMAMITHLKQQIEHLRDYKEQVLVLRVEREHLENKCKIFNEKVKYLSIPGSEQLQLLQEKINLLQQRHESREMTLQNLVRELLRNKYQCKDCKDDGRGTNRQLCYFRQELDHIVGMLQEIANV